MKKYFSLLMVMVLMLLSACGSAETDKEEGKLKVYTTVFPYKSMIEQIGGEHVDVQSIYPKGIDIHTFEPTQKDSLRVAKSELFIYSGKDLDPVGAKIANIAKDKTKVVSLEDAIKESDLLAGEEHEHEHEDEHEHEGHNHGAHDPHIWLDPVLNKSFAKMIKDELVAQDEKHKKTYEENYNKLIKDIDDIDNKLKAVTKNKKHDTVYISHDSLGYLAHRYGFRQEGVSGMNNEEPSQSDIINMINNIEKSNASVILYEQNIPSKTTDIIKNKTNAKTEKFHNMAVLTKDDNENITYQQLMENNIKAIDEALNK
ncbi:zinc ABC transporter substrate-binding protein [Macrococcoides canis]|uniref:metal ABC transporter solute-binding protein, Zn/Mn family n=1 Tax=Macrococcoides canis TaxID=1855823 RepID=UPI00207C9603|nr:zinc ABC transporter substrate-binding protein [Macrococcus canis]MCO4096265.1 zinc ABC transporter substrate-binding protein [Macrococcus canis]UTH10277.1 zinc ABC transporter substrate-binding protein [Macrococcus canis]